MKDWFYGKNGQQFGPVDESTLRARIASGEISRSDLVWTEGMPVWQPLREMPEFFETPEPPPLPEAEIEGIGDDVGPSGSDPGSPYAPPASGFVGGLDGGAPIPGTNGLAVASLVCGILSIFTFCFCGGIFFGIPAVICGHSALGQLRANGNRQSGEGLATAGLVCGYIGIGVFVLMMLGNTASFRFRGF